MWVNVLLLSYPLSFSVAPSLHMPLTSNTIINNQSRLIRSIHLPAVRALDGLICRDVPLQDSAPGQESGNNSLEGLVPSDKSYTEAQDKGMQEWIQRD